MHNRLPRRQFLATSAVLPLLNSVPLFAQGGESDELIVHTKTPMNAEPQLGNLVRQYVTPTEQFYIRSHAPNPKIDPASFRLKVEGLVERELSISLSELANDYKTVSTLATLTCAGNRRYEHSKVSPIKGVPWREGAIGTRNGLVFPWQRS